MARLDALACALALLPLVSSQFLTPLTERQLFRVGEVQKIQYRTKLTEYTIALWQQALAGGGATPGPVVVRVTDGPEREFDWLVQSTSFDLDVSNVFFFWLKEGGLENVGSESSEVKKMSSAYFNVTDQPLPSSSSTFSSAIASSSSSSTTSSTLSAKLSTPSTELSTLSTELSTTAPSTASPTGEDNRSATTANEEDTSGGGLPVAAQAGIGVGVSVVGLTAIVCGILWFRYLRRQQRVLVDLQQHLHSQPPNAADAAEMEMWKLRMTQGTNQHYPAGLGHDARPAELN